MHKCNWKHHGPEFRRHRLAALPTTSTPPLAPHRVGGRRLLVAALLLSNLWLTGEVRAGSTINAATAGSPGAAVSISNTTATKLLNANMLRFGWTVYCAGAPGSVAALMMPGDSANDPASPAPSQTIGFPIPANTLVTNLDFTLRGLDSIHQRVDAEAQGSSAISCYTWEEQ
jgi:hypothetical protein